MKTLGIGTGSSSTTEGAFSHRACRGSCSPAASTCSSSRVQRRRKGEAKMWTYVAVTLLLLECVPSIWSQEFGQQNPMAGHCDQQALQGESTTAGPDQQCIRMAMQCFVQRRQVCLARGVSSGRLRQHCRFRVDANKCLDEFIDQECEQEQGVCGRECVGMQSAQFRQNCLRTTGQYCTRSIMIQQGAVSAQDVCIPQRCSLQAMATEIARFGEQTLGDLDDDFDDSSLDDDWGEFMDFDRDDWPMGVNPAMMGQGQQGGMMPGMPQGMGQGMIPGMAQGMGQGMIPGQGMMPGMGQGVGQGVMPGMGMGLRPMQMPGVGFPGQNMGGFQQGGWQQQQQQQQPGFGGGFQQGGGFQDWNQQGFQTGWNQQGQFGGGGGFQDQWGQGGGFQDQWGQQQQGQWGQQQQGQWGQQQQGQWGDPFQQQFGGFEQFQGGGGFGQDMWNQGQQMGGQFGQGQFGQGQFGQGQFGQGQFGQGQFGQGQLGQGQFGQGQFGQGQFGQGQFGQGQFGQGQFGQGQFGQGQLGQGQFGQGQFGQGQFGQNPQFGMGGMGGMGRRIRGLSHILDEEIACWNSQATSGGQPVIRVLASQYRASAGKQNQSKLIVVLSTVLVLILNSMRAS